MAATHLYQVQIRVQDGSERRVALSPEHNVLSIGRNADGELTVGAGATQLDALLDLRYEPWRLIVLCPDVKLYQNGVISQANRYIEWRLLDILEVDGYTLILRGNEPFATELTAAGVVTVPPVVVTDPSPTTAVSAVSPNTTPPPTVAIPATQTVAATQSVGPIEVTLLDPIEQIATREKPAVWRVQVTNRVQGQLARVASFQFRIERQSTDTSSQPSGTIPIIHQDLPLRGITIQPDMVKLNETASAIVTLTIKLAEHVGKPEWTADALQNLDFIVSSPEYDVESRQPIVLKLEEVHEFYLREDLPLKWESSKRVLFRFGRGKVRLPIENKGNKTSEFRLYAWDRDDACKFEFFDDTGKPIKRSQFDTEILQGHYLFELKPDEKKEVLVGITPLNRYPVGRPRIHHLHFAAERVNGIRKPYPSDQLKYQPLFGVWTFLLLLLSMFVFTAYAVRPKIYTFQLEDSSAIAGTRGDLVWQTSAFAGKLMLEPNEQRVEEPVVGLFNINGSFPITITEDTDYTLTAKNWVYNVPLIGGNSLGLFNWGIFSDTYPVGQTSINVALGRGPLEFVAGEDNNDVVISLPTPIPGSQYTLLKTTDGITTPESILLPIDIILQGGYRVPTTTTDVTYTLEITNPAWSTIRTSAPQLVAYVIPTSTPLPEATPTSPIAVTATSASATMVGQLATATAQLIEAATANAATATAQAQGTATAIAETATANAATATAQAQGTATAIAGTATANAATATAQIQGAATVNAGTATANAATATAQAQGTATAIAGTATANAATATAQAHGTATAIAQVQATATAIAGTATAQSATATPMFTPSATNVPADTPTNTPMQTPTATASISATPTFTPSATDVSTNTPTNTPTVTASISVTPTSTPVNQSLVIQLDATPDSNTDHRFEGNLGSFVLADAPGSGPDDDGNLDTASFDVVAGETYQVTMISANQYSIVAINCAPSIGTSIDVPNAQVSVVLNADVAIMTCTFVSQR